MESSAPGAESTARTVVGRSRTDRGRALAGGQGEPGGAEASGEAAIKERKRPQTLSAPGWNAVSADGKKNWARAPKHGSVFKKQP